MSPAVVVEHFTPKEKLPEAPSIGPEVIPEMGPVNPVLLTFAKLKARASGVPGTLCNVSPDAAVRSTVKVYVVPTLVTVTVPQPFGPEQAMPRLS
jgi:hypothetical protein